MEPLVKKGKKRIRNAGGVSQPAGEAATNPPPVNYIYRVFISYSANHNKGTCSGQFTLRAAAVGRFVKDV
jgi:hypothetical protein